MARGFRMGGAGGEASKKFPWNAYDETWSAKSINIGGNGSGTMACMALSPKIVSGCYISARLTGSTYNLTYYMQVSTDGSTWTTIGTQSGTSNPSFTVSLVNYIGSKIYVRFVISNLTGTDKTCSLNSCLINK